MHVSILMGNYLGETANKNWSRYPWLVTYIFEVEIIEGDIL